MSSRRSTTKISESKANTNYLNFMTKSKEFITNENSLEANILLQHLDVYDIYMLLTKKRPYTTAITFQFIKKIDKIFTDFIYKKYQKNFNDINLVQLTINVYEKDTRGGKKYIINPIHIYIYLRSGGASQLLYRPYYEPPKPIDFLVIFGISEQSSLIKLLHEDIQILNYNINDVKIDVLITITEDDKTTVVKDKVAKKIKEKVKEYLNSNMIFYDESIMNYAKELKRKAKLFIEKQNDEKTPKPKMASNKFSGIESENKYEYRVTPQKKDIANVHQSTQKQVRCGNRKQVNCITPCSWNLETNKCGTSDKKVVIKQIRCGNRKQQNCTIPCTWNIETNKCVQILKQI